MQSITKQKNSRTEISNEESGIGLVFSYLHQISLQTITLSKHLVFQNVEIL